MKEEREKIRLMLYRNTLTNAWLINRLEEKGINTEKSEMSSVLRGVRKGAKAESIIKTSVKILKYYAILTFESYWNGDMKKNGLVKKENFDLK